MAGVIRLGEIAHARSGDKGNHANVGVAAYTASGFEYLRRELTAEAVATFFAALGPTRVERFELPRLAALNFVLYNALGGASRSLRIDSQGKLLGTLILELTLPRPEHLDDMQDAGSTGKMPVAVRLWLCLVREVQVLFRHTFSGLKRKVTASL